MLRGGRDLTSIGDTVLISVTKDGVKFSTNGEIGSANITIRYAVQPRAAARLGSRGILRGCPILTLLPASTSSTTLHTKPAPGRLPAPAADPATLLGSAGRCRRGALRVASWSGLAAAAGKARRRTSRRTTR